ncbi:MAG TPA: glycosyltransferase family 9 protein [bacterium]|nr:glycosyltransferase family 9 protein [bacterium]
MNPVSPLEKKIKRLFWNLTGWMILAEKETSPAKIRSVLVLRPDRLGDFVLSVPALTALQKKLGSTGQWTLVAGRPNAALARYYFPQARVWVFKKGFFSRIDLWLKILLNSFDAVIDLHSYPFSTTTALLSALSGSPARVGFWAKDDFQEYENISKSIFNKGLEVPHKNISEVQKSFLLVEKLFPPAKTSPFKTDLRPLSQETVEEVQKFYSQIGLSSKHKVLGIHPTLQKKDNRWSQKNYLDLIRRLNSIKGLKIIVLHGKGEDAELKEFQKQAVSFSYVFTLPSDDLFFILEAAKRFDALVCNDSGIMHLCAWVTKIIAIFGPSDPKRWGPQNRPGVKHQVFQTKDRSCDSVKPQKVVLAVKRELSEFQTGVL